jgi:hypothetical protein
MVLKQGAGTWSPDTYQRIEWTFEGSQFHWCTVTYGHANLTALGAVDTTGVHVKNATHNTCGSYSNSLNSPIANGIKGSWVSNWGTDYIITNTNVYDSSGPGMSKIVGVGANFLYLLQGNGTYAPGTYQKIEWTWDAAGTSAYQCTTTYGKPSMDELVVTSTVGVHVKNATHDMCGSFSNTVYSPVSLAIAGSWADNWGSYYIINASGYFSGSTLASRSTSEVLGFGSNYVYLKQGAGTYSPGTYVKIAWTWAAVGTTFHWCTTTYGHDSFDSAHLATASTHLYNATHSICGAFSNTISTSVSLAANPICC